MDYALHHHNHMPQPVAGMMSPLDLLLKTQSPQSNFQDMHVWGCPCYVLEPELQDEFQNGSHDHIGQFLLFFTLSLITCAHGFEYKNRKDLTTISCGIQ